MKLLTFGVLLSLFLTTDAFAQKTDKEYTLLIDKADSLLFGGEIDQSITIFKEVIKESSYIKNDSIVSEALSGLASIYSVLGMSDSLIPLARQALALQNPGTAAMIDIHTHIGGNRRNALDHDSALYHFKKAVAINKKQSKGDSIMMASSLMEITGSFTSLNMGDSALTYCLEAINYVESVKRKNALAYAYTRISDVFKSLYNLQRAQDYAEKALDASKDLTFKAPKIEAKITMAQIQYLKGDFDAAIQNLEDALSINDGKKNRLRPKIELTYLECKLARDGTLNDSDNKMLADLKINSQEEHDKNIIKLIDLKASNSKFKMPSFEATVDQLWSELDADNKLFYAKELLNLQHDYYKANSEWKKALKSKEEISIINSKHLAAQQQFSIYELEAKYKKSEQDNAIKLLDKQNEIQTININNKNKLLMAGGLGLGLISLLAMFLFSSRRTITSQNNEISRSLEEKDTLLREIHHRVKNNLQVISSLLRLQSNTTEDHVAIEALKEGQSRVQSMSLIHQNLYQKENLTGIIMSDYLGKLCHNLIATYDINKKVIDLELDIQDLKLDVDSVVPLGLIINELITNSLKYAFPDNREGLIKISLKEMNNKLQLIVSDNGVGISSMEEMGETNTFGHRLINSFARKLDAEIFIDGKDGTRVEMLISEYEKMN